jgi:hypothetical protein
MRGALSRFQLLPAIAVALIVWVGDNLLNTLPPKQVLFDVARVLTGNNLGATVGLNIAFEVAGYCAFLFAVAILYFTTSPSEENISRGLQLGLVCWIIERALELCARIIWPYYGYYWDILGLVLQMSLFAVAGALYDRWWLPSRDRRVQNDR